MNCTIDSNCSNGYCKAGICKELNIVKYQCNSYQCSYAVKFTEIGKEIMNTTPNNYIYNEGNGVNIGTSSSLSSKLSMKKMIIFVFVLLG